MLSQVCNITGLETHIIQNWVKRGFVSPPHKKKYTKDQLCRVMMLNMLKDIMPLPSITEMLSCVCGEHRVTDDCGLYYYFTDSLSETKEGGSAADAAIKKSLAGFSEGFAGAKSRLSDVLKTMLTAYIAAEQRKKAMIYAAQLMR